MIFHHGRALTTLLLVLLAPVFALAADVTFLVTSDSHYDALENEDRNKRNRATLDEMNRIAEVRWPETLGGDVIVRPRGVLVLGDVIDDGDRMRRRKNQSELQFRHFLADFGLDGTDGRLRYPVFEGWGNHDGPPIGRERFGFSFQSRLKEHTMKTLCVLVTSITVVGSAGIPAPAQEDPPQIVPDPSAGSWVVDRLAGNGTAGPVFFQGPAREVGGLGRCGACPLPDGRVLIPFREGLAELDTAGTLRLVAEGRFLFATTGQVTANVMAYNTKDKRVYVAGPNCIRRLAERSDGPWQVELVAGTPNKPGYDDGPAREATFTRVDSIVANSRGTLFILDGNKCIRKLEDGRVSTLTASVSSGPDPVDGPLDQARFHMIGLGGNLTAGENDDVLYLSDHWNFVARRIDLKSETVSTVAGMPKPTGKSAREKRFNSNADGPALRWASFNSGCAYVCWDPIHQALWCGGPDEHRFRWLKDGQIRTVIGIKGDRRWPWEGVGVPAEVVRMAWNAVVAVDAQGRVSLNCSENPSGLWRAYNRQEVKP